MQINNVVVLKDMMDIVVEACLDDELREMQRDYEYEAWLDSLSAQQMEEMCHEY